MENLKKFIYEHKMTLTISVICVIVAALVAALIFALVSQESKTTLKNNSSSQVISDGESTLSDNMSASSEGESDMSSQESNVENSSVNSADKSSGTTSTGNNNSASSNKTSSTGGNNQTPSTKYMEYTKYNLDTYLTPVWKNKVVYNESIMFFPNAKTKEYDPAPLLYTPTKVLSVRSSDLKTEFKEGVDYVVENGKIKLTKNSSIYKWDYNDYYLQNTASVPIGSVRAPGRYIRYASGNEYAEMQLAVTYEHNGSWSGAVPKYAGSTLKNTISKLKGKKALNIVYYGDSIMTGCEATATHNMDPFMPIFTEMITAKLKKTYNYNNINQFNTAVGGWTVNDGVADVHARVTEHNPDLVVIGFGMNIPSKDSSVAKYEESIRNMIKDVRAKNPNAEFILVSTTLPNPDCNGWTSLQPVYKTALESIAKDTTGVALVPMTDIHQYLLTKKRYDDMNGNGVNHPNDFLARIYGQAIAQCLIENLG